MTVSRHIDKESENFNFNSLIEIIGGLSTIILLLASIIAWSFSRGFTSALNLSSSLFSLSTSIDKFAGIVLQYLGGFLTALFGGIFYCFVNPKENRKFYTGKKIFYITLIALSMIVWFISSIKLGISNKTFLTTYKIVQLILTLFLPFLLGHILMHTIEVRKKVLYFIGMFIITVNLYQNQLFEYGIEEGNKIIQLKENQVYESGMAASKTSDFPICSLITSKPISCHLAPEKIVDSYCYKSNDSIYFKLITETETMIYFLERSKLKNVVFSVQKNIVEQMIY